MTTCGIYKITNIINGHSYIGQSVEIEDRWVRHKWSAFNEKEEEDYPLYRAFRKYGLEAFKFEIIKECPREELTQWEKYYINYYDTFINGYNQTSGGEGHYGQEKPVYQYDLNGNFIRAYPSIAEAARQLNIKKQNIYKCCHKKHKTANGYQWRQDPNDKPGKTTYGQGKRVYQYDLEYNLIKDYPSLAQASRDSEISLSHLKRALYGKITTAGGFI